jgi:ATP-dependent exoDNAse (exonuclease V) beta subunit
MEAEVNETICKVCGRPPDEHFVRLRYGIAHTCVNTTDRPRFCSAEESERQHMLGRIEALLTVIRSLRNRVGRLRSRGRVWAPEDVEAYTDKLLKDREHLIGYEQLYYRWEKP